MIETKQRVNDIIQQKQICKKKLNCKTKKLCVGRIEKPHHKNVKKNSSDYGLIKSNLNVIKCEIKYSVFKYYIWCMYM